MSPVRAAVDRSRPPLPGKLRPFEFPAFEHARLANGLRVFAARMPRVPLVSLQLLLPGGSYVDSADRPGLAHLHGSLLSEGTAGRTSLEIASAVESLGGFVASGAGWNMAYVDAGLLSKHLTTGVELLAEIARRPDFPAAEVERLVQNRRAEILRLRGDPSALAAECFIAAVYGRTVYGKPRIGTEESLAGFDRDSLLAFYRRHVGPGGSAVIAVGDLATEETIALVERHFGEWPRISRPPAPVIEPQPLGGIEVHIVDRPQAAQTQLQLGHVGPPRVHPDFHRLRLLNTIFGGKFTSRINLNLREKHGYTYGAHSRFAQRLGPGPFLTTAAVATEVAGAAVDQLLFEMRRIREEKVSTEELRETRDYLVGVFPYTLQTVGDLTQRLETIAVFDLPLDYYDTAPVLLSQVDCEDILAAARQHFDPDHLAIVAVGPAAELQPQLESLGPLTVHQP